jgi:hypothetical protein
MSPLAGLLIEYFVIGAVAALWAVPELLKTPLFLSLLAKEAVGIAAATLTPVIYLLGMCCDLIGALMLKPLKHRIDEKVWKDCSLLERSSQVIHAYAIAYKPELAREIDIRSSRDRIARGSLVASLPLIYFAPFGQPLTMQSSLVASVVIAAVAMLWYRTQKLSAQYEAAVVSVLLAKDGVTVPPKVGKA